MSQLNSLLESANPYKSLQSDAARLANKWGKTGLLEGIEGETDKNNMSMILENQAKAISTENLQNRWWYCFSWYFYSPGTGAQWAGVALPLVRKVFGQIAAKEFVSVQPMNSTFRSSILSRFPIWNFKISIHCWRSLQCTVMLMVMAPLG